MTTPNRPVLKLTTNRLLAPPVYVDAHAPVEVPLAPTAPTPQALLVAAALAALDADPPLACAAHTPAPDEAGAVGMTETVVAPVTAFT